MVILLLVIQCLRDTLLQAISRMFCPEPGGGQDLARPGRPPGRADHPLHAPAHLPAFEGRPAAAGVQSARRWISQLASGSTSIQVSGCSGRPKMRRGLVYHARDQVIQGQPALMTRRSAAAAGRSPGRGSRAAGSAPSFSARVCGAWSVAKQSITSRLSHSACRSAGVARRGRTSPRPAPRRGDIVLA